MGWQLEQTVPTVLQSDKQNPSFSADWPPGSHQNRKWFSPPVDVSLEQSEGSVLSEDALDTEDDGLDTGDDLDVSIDELDTPDEADLPGHFTSRTYLLAMYHQKHIPPL